jgi:hypothetical protein
VSVTTSPEDRSKINKINATRHGLYGAELKLTTELVRALQKHYAVRRAYDEICEDWWDLGEFVRYVVAHFGVRTATTQYLTRVDESEPWQPGNVAGWVYRQKRMRRRARRLSVRCDPVTPLLDCACDHRAQEVCVSSSRPCHWAVAARDQAPWWEPPDPEENV